MKDRLIIFIPGDRSGLIMIKSIIKNVNHSILHARGLLYPVGTLINRMFTRFSALLMIGAMSLSLLPVSHAYE